MMTMNNPCHPGEIIREEIINALGLEITEAARALRVDRTTLSRLLNEKAGLSPEMAIRIEKAFGPSADHLMRMQVSFEMARARKNAGRLNIQAYHPT